MRQHLLASIDRIVKNESLAAGAVKEPVIEHGLSGSALVNDSALTKRIGAALVRDFGPVRAVEGEAEMVSEDFSEFPLAGIPSLQFRIGAVDPIKWAAAQKSGTILPSLHSSEFAPDLEPALRTAIEAEVVSLRELLVAGRLR